MPCLFVFLAAEASPQLHLTLPGPACSSSETDWIQPFDGRPVWLASNKIRECWDLFQACETVESDGFFRYCELAYEKRKDSQPAARKLILSGITRDIPVRATWSRPQRLALVAGLGPFRDSEPTGLRAWFVRRRAPLLSNSPASIRPPQT